MTTEAGTYEESLIQQAEECYKVCGSFKYFITNYCHIEDKVSHTPILFKLWKCQSRILRVFLTATLLIILKARQLGLTWMCAAYSLWLCITRPAYLVVVISAKGEWAVEFLDRCYFILRRLPEWIYPTILKETSEVLRFKHKDGDSTIKSLTTTEAGAQSKTPDLLILDETCWNPYIREIFSASKPGIDAAGGRIIVISNSIKHAPGWGWTRDIYTKSMAGINTFKRIFLGWFEHPARKANFIDLQIDGGMDPQDASEHYPATEEEAISTKGGSYFGTALERHKYTTDGDTGKLWTRNKEVFFSSAKRGIVEVWRYPYDILEGWDGRRWLRRYAIGSDVSEGLGRSYSVAYVIDRLYDEIVCRVRSRRVDAHEWGTLLDNLSKWYDKALVCAERNGAGITTVKRLLALNTPQYVRLKAGKRGSPVTQEFGWSESDQAKHELCADLNTWLKIMDGTLYCSVLIDECSTFILTDTNKLEPEDDNKFGDCVMAAGCAVQASKFLGKGPELVPEGDTGWMKDWKEKRI